MSKTLLLVTLFACIVALIIATTPRKSSTTARPSRRPSTRPSQRPRTTGRPTRRPSTRPSQRPSTRPTPSRPSQRPTQRASTTARPTQQTSGSNDSYGQVRSAGIPISSSRNCRDRSTRGCTSLDGVRSGTIQGIVAFKRSSNCPVTITGGTEVGHSTRGSKTHSTGYKLDISLNSCVNSYITSRFRNSGVRGDGATMYTNPSGHVFAREGNHWDIVF